MRPQVFLGRCPADPCQPGPAQVFEIDVEGARVTAREAVTFEGPHPLRLVATADGRYLVWLGSETETCCHLALYDRVSRSAAIVSRHGGMPTSLFGAPIVAHEREVSVLVQPPGQPLLHASAAGVRAVIPDGRTLQFHGTTSDGRIALLADRVGARRVDVETGHVLNEVVGREFTSYWAISGDGADLFGHSVRFDPVAGQVVGVVTRYQASTGAIVAEREFTPDQLAYGLTTEPRSGRLYVDLLQGRYLVLDPTTLAELGTVATSIQQLPLVPVFARVAFDPHHPRALLLATRQGQPGVTPAITRFDIIDTNTFAVSGGADLGTAIGLREIVVVPRPPAPMSPTATVSGSRVTLRWTSGAGPGLANGYLVEAGSGPGLANLARMPTGAATELVVDGVPRGTYFVRVRAGNWGGTSDPSTEITVSVP